MPIGLSSVFWPSTWPSNLKVHGARVTLTGEQDTPNIVQFVDIESFLMQVLWVLCMVTLYMISCMWNCLLTIMPVWEEFSTVNNMQITFTPHDKLTSPHGYHGNTWKHHNSLTLKHTIYPWEICFMHRYFKVQSYFRAPAISLQI